MSAPIFTSVKQGGREFLVLGNDAASYDDNKHIIGDVYTEVDGYLVFVPNLTRQGYWPAYLLRAIADYLDERNKEWDNQLKAYFAKDMEKKKNGL